ncbi:hypothetical protein [Brevundimonas sp. LjRoot202]|uniref:hypothetical protein n=1 Tax=Brevundimonas sp. LjRoot202 TaxID=3342281 RepID=UPI003ECFC7E5
MFAQTPVLLAAAVVASASPVVAQAPAGQSPALVAAPLSGQTFPPGAEVLSVDGELLGVLILVETRPGGERILHIRRAEGSMTTAPAIVASRGERAVVLDWTRAEFESAATTVGAGLAGPSPAPTPPAL